MYTTRTLFCSMIICQKVSLSEALLMTASSAYSSFQCRNLYFDSETPGDSKNTFLRWGDVLGLVGMHTTGCSGETTLVLHVPM